ncbi:MAG TPA: hypothetical protein VGM88_14410 [Kofleriaceae bacterium]|jgi:hypothetical protein
MRFTAALLAASLLATTACTAHERYVAGGALMAGGTIAAGAGLASAHEPCNGDQCGFGPNLNGGAILAGGAGIVAIVAGGILLIAGTQAAHREQRDADLAAWQTQEREQLRAAQARIDALRPRPVTADSVPQPTSGDAALTKTTIDARVAAREHRCDDVRMAAHAVSANDATFYRSQFLADPFVAACLAR